MLQWFDKILARPDLVFRLAGLILCVVTGASAMFTHLYLGPGMEMGGAMDVFRLRAGNYGPALWVLPLDALFFGGFGWAFWLAMDNQRLLNPSRSATKLLAVQVLIGFLATPALFFTVIAEACFILKPRRASALALLLSLLGMSLFLLIPSNAPLVSLSNVAPGLHSSSRLIVIVMQCLMFPMILFFSYCLGLLGATEWRNRRELTRINAELKATQQLQAESARLAERLYISRELHDAVGHHLAALSVNLQLASHLTEGEAAESIRQAHLVARTLLADVREVVGSLRHDATIDLRSALQTLASGVKYPNIQVDIKDELKNVDPLQAHTLFRCAQEIITNTIRHANAQNLWLSLEKDEHGIALRARDDGDGSGAVNPGNGLTGMRERVEEFGGRLQLETQRNAGFSAEIFLPHAGGAQ
jgi:signal transduction histidine kinase